MRIKVHSLNLGLFYEICLICDTHSLPFFEEVKESLERDFSCRTWLYVYDRDPLDKKAKRIIRQCYSNVFILSEGSCQAAANDKNHPLRKICGFVQSRNRHSISLVSLGTPPKLVYKDEMRCFNWLHQKVFDHLILEDAEWFAEELVEETRLNFSHRERKRFCKYSGIDINEISTNYGKLAQISIGAMPFLVIALLLPYLDSLASKMDSLAWILGIISFILGMVGYLCIFFVPIVPIVLGLYFTSTYYDVSTIFANFRKKVSKWLVVILSLAGAYGVVNYALFIYDYVAEPMRDDLFWAMLLDFIVALTPTVIINLIFIAYSLTMYHLKAENFLTFARKQKLFLLTVMPAMLLVGAAVTALVYSIFLTL